MPITLSECITFLFEITKQLMEVALRLTYEIALFLTYQIFCNSQLQVCPGRENMQKYVNKVSLK